MTSTTEFSDAIPGFFSAGSIEATGTVIRVDDNGFGFVAFNPAIRASQPVQLGYFNAKTELSKHTAENMKRGLAVTVTINPVNIQVPDRAGPLALPIAKMELKIQ